MTEPDTKAAATEPRRSAFGFQLLQDFLHRGLRKNSVEKFKQLAEQYTSGAVKVEVYANSTLYKDKEEMEALQLGAVQLLAPSLAKFGPLGVREFEVFDLPYIFDGYDALNKITQGPVGAQLLAKLEPKGIRGLAFWDNGFKSFSANTPIKKPEDLRGKKMRIQSSKVLEEQMREVKSLPQVMAFSEVYQALQTGVVDAMDNAKTTYWLQKFYEVGPHFTDLGHIYSISSVGFSMNFWKRLTPELQAHISAHGEGLLDTISLDGQPVTIYFSTSPQGWTYVTGMSRERFQAVTVWPASHRRRAIGKPIRPMPRTAMCWGLPGGAAWVLVVEM